MWVSSHLVSEQVLLQVLRRYLEIRGFCSPQMVASVVFYVRSSANVMV